MGIKGDFSEVAQVWRDSSWKVKIYLALSAFLASASIASLADTVFLWKGFISDAVSFYQKHITNNIQTLLEQVFSDVHSGTPHLIVLSAIYLTANIRVSKYSIPKEEAKSIAIMGVSRYTGSLLALLLWFYITNRELEGTLALGIFTGAALGASVSYWSLGGTARTLWLISLLGPFIFVGLIAAITNGLSR